MKFIIQILIFQFAPSKQITNNIFYPLYSQPRNWPPHNILMEKFAFNISLYQGPISIGCYMPICRYRHIGADMPRFLFLLPRCRCRVADADVPMPSGIFRHSISIEKNRHFFLGISVPIYRLVRTSRCAPGTVPNSELSPETHFRPKRDPPQIDPVDSKNDFYLS